LSFGARVKTHIPDKSYFIEEEDWGGKMGEIRKEWEKTGDTGNEVSKLIPIMSMPDKIQIK
jgi:hypothetical protein